MAGNENAVRFLRDISFLSHVYDDLIDKDKSVPQDHVHALMWKALIAIPTNPFYQAHQDMLRPLLITGIINWHGANQIEARGDVEELHISHATRYSIGDIALMAMALTGGQEHAIKNASRCRLLFQNDTWEHYLKEHSRAN